MAKLLITGGCGFIGREVVKQAVQAGHKVKVIDNLSKQGKKLDGDIELNCFDLSNISMTLKEMEGIEVCIHLAAKIGGIGYFHKYPATILSENNMMYSSVFESAVKTKIRQMVYVSSSMVFESAVNFPSKEDDVNLIPPPVTAYGFSKLIGEWYCKAFYDEHKLPFTIIRPFNAYGPNEEPGDEIGDSHVIPDMLKKMLIDRQFPVEILGDGEQTRCFTHVSDVANAVLTAVDNESALNETFNVANPKEMKIKDLTKLIFEKCFPDKEFKTIYKKGFKYDIRRRVPDVKKIQNKLNWKAKVDFENGLDDVIRWFKSAYGV